MAIGPDIKVIAAPLGWSLEMLIKGKVLASDHGSIPVEVAECIVPALLKYQKEEVMAGINYGAIPAFWASFKSAPKKTGYIHEFEELKDYAKMQSIGVFRLSMGVSVGFYMDADFYNIQPGDFHSYEDWEDSVLAYASNHWREFGVGNPEVSGRFRACIGGSKNGEFINSGDTNEVKVVPPMESPTTPMFGYNESVSVMYSTYRLEKLGIDVKQGTFWARAMFHESVPREQFVSMFRDCLQEFPALRLHPDYYPFWRHRNEW